MIVENITFLRFHCNINDVAEMMIFLSKLYYTDLILITFVLNL